MARLFVGLQIPHTVASELAALRGGLPRARWIDPCDYHVTLRFIGDVDERRGAAISRELADIQCSTFALHLEGLDCFGKASPRAVVARIRLTPPLMSLQDDLEKAVRRLGLAPETRKFTPHITLARLARSAPREVADYLGVRQTPPSLEFRVSEFVLFSSKASKGGGPYLAEAIYPFEMELEGSIGSKL